MATLRTKNAKCYDVAIVGGGAAGLNAALMLGRARRNVVVFDHGRPRNAVADKVHGFLSRDGVPPGKLLRMARADLRRYSNVKLVEERIVKATVLNRNFFLTSKRGKEYESTRLLLANGVVDKLPNIAGLPKFWGRSVFVCPFCDGWEIRDKNVAVFGDGVQTIELAQELYGWTSNLVVLGRCLAGMTQEHRRWLEATKCRVIESNVGRLVGTGGLLHSLELASGEQIPCDALFLTSSLRQTCSLANLLNCRLDDQGAIVVDDQNQTNVRGCYAAGDAVTHVHQVIFAAASGARAAVAICRDLLSEEACDIARHRRAAAVSFPSRPQV